MLQNSLKSKIDDRYEEKLNGRTAKQLVDDQAEDETLWFSPKYITEKHLQSSFRLLSYAVEKESRQGGNNS